ncbi:MAG: hypothetical protein R6V12_03970 [Candidatus Hydrogenedentota bacterium]
MRNFSPSPFCLGLLASIAVFCSGQSPAQLRSPGTVDVLTDFVALYEEATVSNAQHVSAGFWEQSGDERMPGMFLHPTGGGDAVLEFENVSMPALREEERCFLIFNVGLRPGFDWDATPSTPNGVRFSICIDGRVVYEEDVAEHGWKPRAIDMSPWTGRRVSVGFRTNAISGNTNYDWAVFGEPLLLLVRPASKIEALASEAKGLALVEVKCSQASRITLSVGPSSVTSMLAEGTHLLPVAFDDGQRPELVVESGAASILNVYAGLYGPELEIVSTELSSPLVTAGKAFHIIQRFKNNGRGTYTGGATWRLTAEEGDLKALGPNAGEALVLDTLQPGEEGALVWHDLVADDPGDWQLDTGRKLDLHVFAEEQAAPSERSEEPVVIVERNGDLRAIVANAWARLCIVVDDTGYAYAKGDVWNGTCWKRVASVYPLARLMLRREDGAVEELRFRVSNIHPLRSTWLSIYGTAESEQGNEWPILLLAYAEANSPRIHLELETLAPHDADIAAFSMPTVLAGDRAFGARKDFALFPGLEYLEGEEASSSTRDLAPPLNDRRVPAAHKITTPLMAVQGDNALVALLWDATQEWASGLRHPAARFLAPEYDSGMEYCHMSLFAPSVGDFVQENQYEAKASPFPVKKGQRLHLEAWLVLDHRKRYDQDSIVCGPHSGGLILQAMQHWFDLFGLPGPGTPPRDWEEEKALCRHAYFDSVWHEEPPGWSHCHGWRSAPAVGHAVPLLLDLNSGVAPNVAAEIERRIDLVTERALKEVGPRNLWTPAACHIMRGEFPFLYGYLPDALKGLKESAYKQLHAREDGLWVWRPADEKHKSLGIPGDHTLGQAAVPAMHALRAARLTGDSLLAAETLDAMKQMERYEVPRGAQTWECPLYQPDILAAGYAIRAYCEAYRLTGDPSHLEHARHWAWSGLPFLYMWEIEGIAGMRYNVIAVIGSTFYHHSWLGLPVVWCGLVYGYGLQDLAQFDDSFPWNTIAEGILMSAMRQQYTSGPSKGCYPDSWNMVENRPNPADINPENILVNGFRLRGQSPEINVVRFERDAEPPIFINSPARIVAHEDRLDQGQLRFTLGEMYAPATHTFVAPVGEPSAVTGAGDRSATMEELQTGGMGWLYDAELKGIVLKHSAKGADITCEIQW